MKFTIPKNTFATAMARCAAIAERKASMPILCCVLLEPLEEVLKISATDLKTGYITAIDGIGWEDYAAEGLLYSIAVPAKKLLECVKAIPAEEIEITIVRHVSSYGTEMPAWCPLFLDPLKERTIADATILFQSQRIKDLEIQVADRGASYQALKQELLQIHSMIMCTGEVTIETPADAYTPNSVKQLILFYNSLQTTPQGPCKFCLPPRKLLLQRIEELEAEITKTKEECGRQRGQDS